MARLAAPPISVSRRGSARGDPDCTVVWLRGEHDLSTKVPLVVTLARAARLDHAPLLVDLSAVTFMDASTVGALLVTRSQLHALGQSLEVRSPSARARRVLDLCGVAELIHEGPPRSTGAAPALGSWVEVPAAGSAPAVDRARAEATAMDVEPAGR